MIETVPEEAQMVDSVDKDKINYLKYIQNNIFLRIYQVYEIKETMRAVFHQIETTNKYIKVI